MSKVRFRTHAHIKSIIGKDLITDDNNAVLELVKNSFDAGSDKVDIIYKNLLKNDDIIIANTPTQFSSKLIIKDEGSGMSEYDITEKWLNIAYSEKKDKREEFGRVLAGNKGVGRFSCDRLGRFLTIYSKTSSESDYKTLFIDWQLFEEEGQIDFNIQDVELNVEYIDKKTFTLKTELPCFEAGTVLEIANLRETWNASKILGLKRQLERLINPNQAFKNSNFGVKLFARDFLQHDKVQEEYNKINGDVKNRIFEKIDFKTSSIQAVIDETGKFITTTLQDRGNNIFSLKERNTFSELSNIAISVYYLNPYSKAYFTRQTGIKAVDFGSIFLFINGFRIPPYGDIGDDWLGMEIRKGQGHSRYLGTREVVGRIEINDDLEKFKIISNRTGVVNNVAFQQLTKSSSPFGFYYKIFRRLERFVVEGIKWDSSPIDANTIEKEVNSKKWDESKEIYNEDLLARNKRILSVITNIVDAKKDDIIFLKINEEFVRDIISEQTERAKSELEDVIKLIAEKSKELNPDILSEVITKVSQSSEELKRFSNVLPNYSNGSKKEIESLNSIQDSLINKYEELIESKKQLEETLKIQKEAREKAEQEKQAVEEALQVEKKKNTFLLATSKNVTNDTLGLIHHIQHETPKIDSEVELLITKVNNDELKKKDILSRLYKIKLYTNKVSTIGKLITRTNFNEQAKKQKIDLAKYIIQYISIYTEVNSNSEMTFHVDDNNSSFITKISAIEVAIIFDNLIHNSFKAFAKKIKIDLKSSKGKLEIDFSDDGKGLDKQFLNNPNAIFELGITSTDGSGIGLFTVVDLLKKMKGEVTFVGNNKVLKGATFKITFNQDV